MADVIQPRFDPPYEPAPDGNGGFYPDSILVQCHTDTTNLFIYNAWDMQPRWFGIHGPNGETYYFGGMEVGQGVEVPNIPGVRVDYYSGDVYPYNIIPGQCVAETTTTTAPPTTTTPTTTPETPTTTVPSTIPEETTTTSSPPEETTTTVPVPTSSSLPTTTETSQSPTTSATVLGICTFDSAANQYRNSQTGEPMVSSDCPQVALTPVSSSSQDLSSMPRTGVDASFLLFAVILLVAVGTVLVGFAKLHLRKNNNPLTGVDIHERITT